MTSGLTLTAEVTSALEVGGALTVVLTGEGEVDTIRSSHFPGTRIQVQVADGEVVFQAGGNIHVGGPDALRIGPGGTVGLVRFDDGPDWVVSSVVGAL